MIHSLFLSHGSPMLALEDAPTTRFLRALSADIPKPKAIIIASAHWETKEPMLTGAVSPKTIHDFNGFPNELYELQYPTKGDPELALRIQSMFNSAGILAGIDETRGLDHGAWNPLLLMYPNADIPVIELSVQPEQSARWHYNIGKVLESLRDEDILVIGTGNLTHNLYEAFRGGHKTAPAWVSEFAQWIESKIKAGDVDSLLSWERLAPHALKNHPTPEHFLPFFVALGAGGGLVKTKHLHDDVAMGVLAMDAYAFG